MLLGGDTSSQAADVARAQESWIDEGVNLQRALRKNDQRDGRQAVYGQGADGQPKRVRAINPRHNPTQDTLSRLQASPESGAAERQAALDRRVINTINAPPFPA